MTVEGVLGGTHYSFVMPGLEPGIHVFVILMDARVEPTAVRFSF